MRLVLSVEILVFPAQSDGIFPSYPLLCVEFIVTIGFGWAQWCGFFWRFLSLFRLLSLSASRFLCVALRSGRGDSFEPSGVSQSGN
jgi:hypothetical protein